MTCEARVVLIVLDTREVCPYPLYMPAQKFTARNLPALITLARECGLEYNFRNSAKCYTFSPNDLDESGDFPAASDEDHAKLERFVTAADAMFGTREMFSAYSAHRFARVSWERDCRTESQRNNCD